jgi:hypothetical protein
MTQAINSGQQGVQKPLQYWLKLATKVFLFFLAVLLAFGLVVYFAKPTIAHAQNTNSTTINTQKTTVTTPTASKPLDPCVTIGGCIGGIEKFKTQTSTVEGSVAGVASFIQLEF